MKNITDIFTDSFRRKDEKGYEKLFILIDIHETILKGTYTNELSYAFYPYAKECLQIMTKRNDVSLILWSCSYGKDMLRYDSMFKENGICFDHINENKEIESSWLACFDTKPYFDILLDNKAGFEADKDWKDIYEFLCKKSYLEKH